MPPACVYGPCFAFTNSTLARTKCDCRAIRRNGPGYRSIAKLAGSFRVNRKHPDATRGRPPSTLILAFRMRVRYEVTAIRHPRRKRKFRNRFALHN